MSSLDDFKYIEGGCHLPNGGFMRNRMMTADRINDFRKEFKNTGLYLSAYWYNNEDVKEAELYGHFYLDFDDEENFEKARRDACDAVAYLKWQSSFNIPERFIRAFFSGKKGVHLVIPAIVFDAQPAKNLNEYYRALAEKIAGRITYGTLDFKVYDRRRLFRMPNSIHQKTGLFKVPLSIDELRTATYDEILEKAKTPQSSTWDEAHEITRARAEYGVVVEDWKNRFDKKFNKDRVGKTMDFDPPCVKQLLEEGPQRGNRNNTAAALVSHFKSRGDSEQEAWDKIVEWNSGSLDDRELKTVMKSVYSGGYRYGCSTLEKLASCDPSCPIKTKGRGY